MRILNYFLIGSLVLVVLIQIYRFATRKENPIFCLVKGYFNYLTLQVYIITIASEGIQIRNQIVRQPLFHGKMALFEQLEHVLFLQSISIFLGIVFVVCFMRNMQHAEMSIRRFPLRKGCKVLIQSLFQASLINLVILALALLENLQSAEVSVAETLRLSYVRILLIASGLSSISPIMQVLLDMPLVSFVASVKALGQPFIREIKFKYVQLQQNHPIKDEVRAEMTQGALQFDEEEPCEESKETSYGDLARVALITGLRCFWKSLVLLWRAVVVLYNTVQLLLAFMLIFGFCCIFVQMANPNSTLLSELNAVNYFTSGGQSESYRVSAEAEHLFVFVIGAFKLFFILWMYYATHDCIKYSRNDKLIDEVTNLTVIIRKNLLNFSLIALLTTLYPNLTFTINNSSCYKEYSYEEGAFVHSERGITKEYTGEDRECPITLTYLLASKMFEGHLSKVVGLFIILLYILMSMYIVIKHFKKGMQP